MNLESFYNLIKDICPTFHYESGSEEFPRQVYTEYATSYEYSSNQVYNKVISINLSHFSKTEFDETEKQLEMILMQGGFLLTVDIKEEKYGTRKIR